MNLQPMRTILSCGLVLAVGSLAVGQQQSAATFDQEPNSTTLDSRTAFDPKAVKAGMFKNSVGLQYLDGRLIGGGHRFKAYFDADGVEYTPALPPLWRRNGIGTESIARLTWLTVRLEWEQTVLSVH